MSLQKYDYEKLLDDIKLISKAIRIVRDENDPDNRSFACGLVKDMLTRFRRDMKEMKNLSDFEVKKLHKDVEILQEMMQIVRDENNTNNRVKACEVVSKMVTRLHDDVEEFRDQNEKNGRSFE